ncbi:MAG TPA: RimK family alpha-L-glutamate ligase [Gaiellaceae bacterium]|jgi:RimK family alpha-L-glutamate ligase|nr:RimK family alpha-L-glutamate ligase [Gaiellaceae bacterium]
MQVAIVAHHRTSTNVALSLARPGLRILEPASAARTLGEGDVAIGRLDVSEGLDGIETGLWELARLEGAGVRVLNRPSTLVAAHDKLATSRALGDAGVPHPRTAHVTSPSDSIPFEPPVVVKPRFGSWGQDVVLCHDAAALRRHLAAMAERPWFASHGALVQELVPPRGHDVRVIVAGGSVVGAIRRVAPPGEWRTNVALGAVREPVEPSSEACDLASRAAAAVEGDLVGVDLLPGHDGEFVVIEINGAVEFNAAYSLHGADVFRRTIDAVLPDPVAAVA